MTLAAASSRRAPSAGNVMTRWVRGGIVRIRFAPDKKHFLFQW
jgi:hypothetical protein